MDVAGFEPATPCLQSRCSPPELHALALIVAIFSSVCNRNPAVHNAPITDPEHNRGALSTRGRPSEYK